MLIKPFKEAIPIVEKLNKAGYDTYFVGGCIRDLFLNRKISDIDIATAADPHVVIKLFPKVIPVGIEHGTVIVRWNHESYEVTTFRRDGSYTDRRRPDEVVFVTNVEEDLRRRDFTINALALTMEGKLIDLFEGKTDLTNKIIRTVGDARKRFLEDPLRIIRALRFSSELGFTIEKKTYEEMNLLAEHIETLAVERLMNEFMRFFQGQYIAQGMQYFVHTRIAHYLPVFKNHIHLLPDGLQIDKPFNSFASVLVYFHLQDDSISLNDWSKEWKCSNQIKNQAINLKEALLYFQSYGLDSWLVYTLYEENITSFIHLLEILSISTEIELKDLHEINSNLQITDKTDLAINGYDLLELLPGAKSGPWMSELIKKIEKMIVMDELLNENSVIKEWVICHQPEIN